MLKVRREKLGPFFEKHNLDALLFSNMLNIRYLSGFTGSEGALLLTRDGAWLLCDSRYTTQAAHETADTKIRQFSEKQDAIGTLIQELTLTRIGFESAHITVAAFMELSGKLSECELIPLSKDVDQIRSCKNQDEITSLEIIARLASDSLQATIYLLKPGVSEAFFARELEFEIRRRGADGRSFDFIVASGQRGAMPHGRASEKLICSGELVTIDFGATLDGFQSDETVTVAVGQPEARAIEIHGIVKEAHDRAIAAVKPGIFSNELDAIARNYITAQGYGEYFGHGLGHGVGLEIHEQPVISPRSRTILEEGMVFTVEPGIYIPGFGGVRIEDTVAVTSNGCSLLTTAPKELLFL